MELRNMSIFAATRDVTTKSTMEEFVSHMVQQRSANGVVMRGVPTMSRMVEFVLHMEQR
jgi:hypothetical protein